MNRFSAYCGIAILTCLSVAAAALAPAAESSLQFAIDRNHSTIGFAAPIMGLSHVRGKFTDFTVNIEYDQTDVTRSRVSAVIKTASIDTGIADRDKHLRSADFFDAEKHPEITFTSTRIEKRGDAYVAHGNFSMRGVSKQIELPFRITGRHLSDDAKQPGNKWLTMGFAAATRVSRQEYGIAWKHNSVPDFIGDQIEIELRLMTRAVSVPAAQAR